MNAYIQFEILSYFSTARHQIMDSEMTKAKSMFHINTSFNSTANFNKE